MKKYNVFGMGNALVDTELQLTDAELHNAGIEKGLMILVDETRQLEILDKLDDHIIGAKRASGGSVANSLVAVSSLGGSAFHMCKVAHDENGEFYLNDLRNAGVDCPTMSHTDHGLTGKCLVAITSDAERSMNTFLGISEQLSLQEMDYQALTNSEYLYIEGYLVTSDTARAAAIEAKKIAVQNGVKTAITLSDPGIVQFFGDGLKEMVGDGMDLIFSNETEALQWTATDTLEAAAEAFKSCAKTFVITLGARGALAFDGSDFISIAPYEVQAIDTLGAGDMFAGSFIYGITNGMDFAQAGDLASKTSSLIVSQYGPRLRAEQFADLVR